MNIYLLKRKLASLKQWLSDHMPTWCSQCRYLDFRKNMHFEQTQWVQRVPLCKDCRKDFFTPFGGGGA